MSESKKSPLGWPEPQGLWDPSREKDSCGVGFIAHLKGKRSHDPPTREYRSCGHVEHSTPMGDELRTREPLKHLPQPRDGQVLAGCFGAKKNGPPRIGNHHQVDRGPSSLERCHIMTEFAPKWVYIPGGKRNPHFPGYPDQSLEEWHRTRGLYDES